MTDPLTPADREAETAGVALNERLAELLGWQQDPKHAGRWIPPGMRPLSSGYYTAKPPDYLTGNGMLALLEEMRRRGWLPKMQQQSAIFMDDLDRIGWFAEFVLPGQRVSHWTVAVELPLAVAQAAIRALEGENG